MAKSITREDLKFWYFLLGSFALVIIWGVRLESKVSSHIVEAFDKGSALRASFESDHELLLLINERTIRMEEKQDAIISRLD